MTKARVETYFNIGFISILFILIIGTPLLFTSYTRSVFEVNKLLLLRISIIIAYALWLLKYLLFKHNDLDNPNKESLTILGAKWRKIGLEIPIFIWLITNILSTLFSQNIYVSVIGAYDRWEGIITIVNYIMLILMFAKLVSKSYQIQWVLWGILGSTGLSSLYGVCQSFGYDFMNWSKDPTFRVFACINNPVHYCAYVAMTVPIGMALILYLCSKEPSHSPSKKTLDLLKWVVVTIGSAFTTFAFVTLYNNNAITLSISTIIGLILLIPAFYLMTRDIKWSIFLITALIYYTQFLSFSRATWLGFIGAMPLFYLLATNNLDTRSPKHFIIDFFASGIAIANITLLYVFKFHLKSPLFMSLITGTLILYIAYSCWNQFKLYQERFNPKSGIIIAIGLGFLLFNYILPIKVYSPLFQWGLHIGLSGLFIIFSLSVKGPIKQLFNRFTIIIIFMLLQFVSGNNIILFLYITLVISYFFLNLKGNTELGREKKFWLLGFLILFAFIIIMPRIPSYTNVLFKSDLKSLKALKIVNTKLGNYSQDALQGTARTSMWKSAIPWFKDYPILGSGLDTIKYMYPTYRRSEYGILEGGHNYTPDRLHNEYLNTLASKGSVGFISYYLILILGWFILILKGLQKQLQSPYRYIIIATLTGMLIYLGQVLFNFGVVATLVLFYIYMGLGLALNQFKESECPPTH